jgi:DNA repair protein RadA/Sms
MAKQKTHYVCQNCGASQPRWLGKCPSCGAWNSLSEELVRSTGGKGRRRPINGDRAEPAVLAEVEPDRSPRIPTGFAELDRVLGGGFVAGSTVLIGGDPGVGKSTLMLQAAGDMAGNGQGVLYVSAEESPGQIRIRGERIEMKTRDLQVLGDGDADSALEWAEKLKPAMIIVDSIQTCRREEFDSAPGTVTQVREVASLWSDYARRSGACVALVGHVTKEGAVAGPRVVEHLVDAVLMFESDSVGSIRILRALKNRHGATGELGVFEMGASGLVAVSDPSRRFVAQRDDPVAGVAVAAVVRGSRPMLIEVEALVTTSLYASPQRNGTGVDPRRMAMWIAVLEKRVGLGLSGRDVFLNATGGVRLEDSGADLAACAAINSSLRDKPIRPGTALLGEVGLTGEVRAVAGMDRRLSEAAHLNLKRVIVPAGFKGDAPKGLELVPVKTLEAALEAAVCDQS